MYIIIIFNGYHVNAQGVGVRMINVHYYYYNLLISYRVAVI